MTEEEFFYHYTTKAAAIAIFLDGRILPSMSTQGDAVHGDGVYLTTLEPRLGMITVQTNNWNGLGRTTGKKIEVYFEIFMPGSKVKRAKDKRDIQVHAGALYLADYKWSLKNWEGELIATQHFKISSEGDAARVHSICMGRYTLVKNILMQDDTPVYKHDGQELYLYRSKFGNWCVNKTAGDQRAWMYQQQSTQPAAEYFKRTGYLPPLDNHRHSSIFLSPSKTLPWLYADTNGARDDVTLRVYPCY